MIFLDANYFLRFWTVPNSDANATRKAIARSLFADLQTGTVEATTSEAVLAEVAHVLTSKRHYNLSAEVAVSYLVRTIRMPGLKFAPGMQQRYLRALEIWSEHPRLEFVDALTVAIVENSQHVLATFDRDFDPFDDIEHWRPENGHAGDDAPPS